MQQMHFWSDYEINGFSFHVIQSLFLFFLMNVLCHFLHESIADVEYDVQPQQRPEPQQSTLGRRKALRLQSNTWRSCSRDLVPQELRVLMFLQWRAAGFTAVTWFTAQYSSSLSICCHCCSFNKASERLTFVFDCIIDKCVLPSLKFQLRTAAFSSKCELKLLGFEHGLWRRSCSILRRSESLKLSMQIWFHLQLTVSLFDRFNVWTEQFHFWSWGDETVMRFER